MLKDIISLKKYFLSLILKSKKISVLMYHSINSDKRFFTVTPDNFEKQINFLVKKKYDFLSLDQVEEILSKRQKIGSKMISSTFDDGYKDNYEMVFPILKKYSIPATIFLVVDLIGKEGYLNWGEIQEMQNSGLVEFGCHTFSHPDLTRISEEEQQKEIIESRNILEGSLGTECFYFSYPSGKFNDKVIKIVREADFKMAFTVQEGSVSFKLNKWELPRLSIDSKTSWWQFLGKISGLQFIKGRI